MLPKNQKTFSITYKTGDGTELSGAFTVRKMSVMDMSRISVKKSQLNEGLLPPPMPDESGHVPEGRYVDEGTDQLNGIIAHLNVCLVSAPPWFDLNEVWDPGILRAVYSEVAAHENSFPLPGRTDQANQEASGAQHQNVADGRNVTPMVVKEVQTPLAV